jgi:hypothetical protein
MISPRWLDNVQKLLFLSIIMASDSESLNSKPFKVCHRVAHRWPINLRDIKVLNSK